MDTDSLHLAIAEKDLYRCIRVGEDGIKGCDDTFTAVN